MTPSATPVDAPRLSEGTLLGGRYRVGPRLGRGGMGEVYAAEIVSLRKPVAIKVLRQEGLEDANRVIHRFLREARASSTIKHPNVVDILDSGEDKGHVYYVMERLQGQDLSRVLQTRGKLPWPFVREILLQAARGLRAAHARGIIHRDVKPANIFLVDAEVEDEGPCIKVLDFGIAKFDNAASFEEQPLTRTAQLLGTAWYMAPEQASTGTATPCSDVYSLGIVAYQLLTGKVPFEGPTTFRVLYRHLQEPPVPPREHEPSIPAPAEALILRALAKDPAHRFPSMHAMIQALAEIPADDPHLRLPEPIPSEVETQVSTVPIPQPRSSRPRSVAFVWGSATMMGLAATWAMLGPGIADGDSRAARLALSTLAPHTLPADPVTSEDARAVLDLVRTTKVADEPEPESEVAAMAPDTVEAPPTDAAPPSDPARKSRTPGPSSPETFDETVKRRLHREATAQCAPVPADLGPVTVSFTVLSDGRVGALRTQGPAYGTPVGQCLEGLVGAARFAAGPLRAGAFVFDPSRDAR